MNDGGGVLKPVDGVNEVMAGVGLFFEGVENVDEDKAGIYVADVVVSEIIDEEVDEGTPVADFIKVVEAGEEVKAGGVVEEEVLYDDVVDDGNEAKDVARVVDEAVEDSNEVDARFND
ncbi:hypothetical protein AGMMS49936_11480 [Endomicrobiia bacterium]|nr:hypothetical protein AGMMS49936_11480 [Endomicrobiia bacterium]